MDKYFYLSQDGDYLLQTRGVQRMMSPDENSGILVTDQGVKIKTDNVECFSLGAVCWRIVSKDGKNIIQKGGRNFTTRKESDGVMRITHYLGSADYTVIVTVDGTESGYQDNILSVVTRTAAYFEVKGKNSTTAADGTVHNFV